MIQVRKFTGLTLLSVAGAAVALWVGVGFWAMWLGPSWFAAQLHDRFGVEAAIGSLRTDFIHSVSFRDVVVSAPVRGRIPEVRFAFRPWDLFSLKSRKRHLFVVTLREPEIKVPRSYFSTVRTDGDGPLRLVPFRGAIENGDISLDTPSGEWHVAGLTGYVRLSPFRLEADGEGNVNGWGVLKAGLRAGSTTPRNWEVRIDSDRLSAAGLLALAPQATRDRVGRLRGDIRLNGVLRGDHHDKLRFKDWRIGATSINVAWLPPDSSDSLPVSGSVGLHKDQLLVTALRIGETKFDGTVSRPWSDAPLDVRFSADRQRISRLVALWRPGEAGVVDGVISGKGTLGGSSRQPRVAFDGGGELKVGAVSFPGATGTLAINDGILLAGIDVASGRLQVHGTEFLRGGRWTVEADRISLKALGAANGWTSVGGTADARVIVEPAARAVSGRVGLDGLRWGDIQMRGRHEAALRLANGRLTASADNGALLLSADVDASGVKIDDFRFSVGGGTLTVSGRLGRRQSDAMALEIAGEGLPLSLWPPIIDRYPEASGAANVRGSVGGTLDSPTSRFDLSVAGLRIRPGSPATEATGRLSSQGRRLVFSDVVIDDTIALSAEVDRARGDWKLDARFTETAPQILADLAGSSSAVSGSISGFVSAQGGADPVASSSFTWSTGHIGNFYFDEMSAEASMSGERVRVGRATLIRGPQALRAQADLRRSGDSWTYDALAQLQRWDVAAIPLDGEIGAQGRLSVPGRTLSASLSTPMFWIADRAVESLRAELKIGRDGWTLSAAAGDDRLRVNAAVNARRELSGRLAARELSIEDLFVAGEPDPDRPPPKGTYDLNAELAGTLDSPGASLLAVVRDASWRDERFSAEAAVQVSTGGVNISSVKMDLASGGRLLAHGRYDFGKAAPLSIDGVASEVRLQSLFHLLSWPVKWSGTADGSFSLVRSSSGIVGDIRFKGEHDGFPPFREGGEFQGQVVGSGREWALVGVKVQSGDGHVDISDRSRIYLDRDGVGTLRILADVRNIQAGPLTFFGGVETVGRWRFAEPGSLTRRHIDLDVFARSLWINQFILDGNVTHMAIVNRRIDFSPIPGSGQQISGALAYDDFPDLIVERLRYIDNGADRMTLDGNVGAKKWDFRLTTNGLDADVVAGLFDTRFPMTGKMDINLSATGSPTKPEIVSDVNWTDGRIGPLPLDTAEARVTFKGGELTIADVVAQRRRGYVAQGDARFGIGAAAESVPMEVNIRVDRGDMAVLEDMFPDAVSRARGSFDGRFRIGGSAGNAAISGFMSAQRVTMDSIYTPNLERGELRLRVERNRLTIDRATARLGKGDLAGGGHIDFVNGRPANYDLRLKSQGDDGIMIRVPQLDIAPGPVLGRFRLLQKKLAGASRGEPVIDLTLKGPAGSPTVAGSVLLENSVFTYPPSSRKGGVGRGVHPLLSDVNWDVTLKAGRRTWYQNELVDAMVTGELTFTGPTDELAVNGRIRSEQGSIVYSGNEFQLKEANLDIESRDDAFPGAAERRTTVYLKATAEREAFYTDALNNSNQEVIVMVVDRAPIGEIQPRFYAKNNPGLSSQRALQLALGLPFGDNIDSNSLLPDQRARISDQADNDKLLRLGLVQLLDSSLASPLARALARNTGLVDFIRVSYQENDPHQPEGIATDLSAPSNDVTQNEFLKYARGTKVKFGRGLGSRLFADYSFRVEEFDSQLNLRHEVELAYRLHRNFFLRGISELDRERELGRPPDRRAILENQWRFGLPRKRPPAEPAGAAPTPGRSNAG